MSEPLISVVIATYDAAHLLPETLASVLAQTHRRCEIVLVDDGSTDGTSERIAPFRASLRYVRQDNAGLGAARNRGLREARGDWIAFLDADDLWRPDTLEVQLAVARRHPESAMVVCDGVQFEGATILSPGLIVGPLGWRLRGSPDGELTGRFYRELVQSFSICCPAQTLLPRRVVEEVGDVTEAREETPDYDYYLRIARAHPITLHRRSLVRWRYRAESLSGEWSRRPAAWASQTLPILRRQLAQAGAGAADRSLLERRIARLEAELLPGFHLSRWLGRSAWTTKYWLARSLPPRLAASAIGLGRAAQEMLRRS